MQHLIRFFLTLFILLACAAYSPVDAEAAAQATGSVEAAYKKTADDWRALLRDNVRGKQRDPWLALEKRFLSLAAQDPKGDTGAKSRFQAARCREELAKRSALTSDWRNAANLYLDLGKKCPRHSLADDGLFQAAYIAAKRLNNPDEARTICETIIKSYPKGDMVENARALLASLPAGQSAGKGDTRAVPAKTPKLVSGDKPASSAAPAATSADKPGSAVPAKNLTQIICRGTSKKATVFLELDGAASFCHQYLAATPKRSARLVVDIGDVALGSDVKASHSYSGMVVSRARSSVSGTTDKRTRVVLDLGNVRHYTVDTGTNPPGIHVQCSVSRDLAGGKTPPAGGKDGPVVQGRFSGMGPGRPGTLMEQLGLTVKTIMIDAGHGGKDPGAMGNGITESQVTLSLANKLGERLKKQGFSVLYTRQNNSFVALDQRPILANSKKADLFVSLHVNASKDTKTNGLETYFLDLARSSSAATVAARENAVSVKSISDLQFILTDLMLTSKLQESQDLAAVVHKSMYDRLRQAGFTVSDNGVRSAPFYVLMGARMPAVLVEIGYLTNAADSRRIKSEKYLERVAEGISLGIVAYRNKLGRFAGK